ncbi:MAG TPA: hypothetical protein VF828_05335, partial [Patescibacteria group bacterium]
KISVIATGFDLNRNRVYPSYKRPEIQPTQTSFANSTAAAAQQNTSTKTSSAGTNQLNDPQMQKLLGDQELPAGVDIVDEFDIPAFLRKNK